MDRRGVARRIAIPIATSILILLLFVGIPMISASVHDETTAYAYQVTSPSVQGTPTVDLTVTALTKDQLKQQDETLQRNNSFPWTILNAVGSSIGTFLVAVAALIAAWLGWRQWLGDRRDARKKQAEERFKSVVEGLGSESTDAKIASAVLLRTFLGPDYKEFYTQVFDLAVAKLRRQDQNDSSGTESSVLPTKPSEPSSQGLTSLSSVFNSLFQRRTEVSSPQSSVKAPQSLDSLRQAFITVFKESFPPARDERKKQHRLQLGLIRILKKLLPDLKTVEKRLEFNSQQFDATDIQLKNAYLFGADLREAWMPGAYLENANLIAARLNKIKLQDAHLKGAKLVQINLSNAILLRADLTKAELSGANLTEARLNGAILYKAVLNGANLTGADLSKGIGENDEPRPTSLTRANLTGARLNGADLTGALLNGANLTGARLNGADLTGALLNGANLTGADLRKGIGENGKPRPTNLTGANLSKGKDEDGKPRPTNLTKANLTGARLNGADLTGALLDGANLTEADLTGVNLSETHPERAESLTGTKMFDVIGLSSKELCEAKGAITQYPVSSSTVNKD